MITDIYIFEIPQGNSPAEAFASGDYIDHFNDRVYWSNDINPYLYRPSARALINGKKYGIKIVASDPTRSDNRFFENRGESEILVFNYGHSYVVPKPEWVTRQEMVFEDPENTELVYQIHTTEYTELTLHVAIKYFVIPEGISAENASEIARNIHIYEAPGGSMFDDTPVDQLFFPTGRYLDPGKRYGAYIQITDPTRMTDGTYAFENNGRSDILVFSIGATGGTDVVLTYPAEGDRLPFSFFPLIARYEPFNPAYQHWKSVCTLLKNGTDDDLFTIDGLRWPGGSQAGQSTLVGLSDITESESQNIAIFKNNAQHPDPFERGADYRWNANVKLFYDVPGTGDHLEFDKSSTFSRGMGPSDLRQPEWGAIIAPDSTFNFKWITADAPEKLLPGHDINHATRRSISYFNGTVDEKWVLEVGRNEALDPVIFHQEGRIGNGEIDYLSGDYTEETILAELYKELESATSFTATDTGYYYWRVKWLKDPAADWTSDNYQSSQIRPFWVGVGPPPGTTTRTTPPPEGCVSECLAPEITNETALAGLTAGSTVSVGYFQMNVTEVTGGSGSRFSGSGEIRIPFLNNIRVSVEFENIRINTGMQMYEGTVKAINDVPSISMDSSTVMIGGQRVTIPNMSESESQILDAAVTSSERLVSLMTDARPIGMPIGLDNEIDGTSYVIGITEMTFKPRKAQLTAVMRMEIPSLGEHLPAMGATGICFTTGGLGDEGRLYLLRDWNITPDDSDVQFSFSGCESGDTTKATYVEWDCEGFKCMSIRGEVEFSTDMMVKEDAEGNILEGESVTADFGVKTCRGGNWIADIGIEPFQIKGMNGWGFEASRAYLDFSDIENPSLLSFPSNYDKSYLGISSSTSETDAARLLTTWKGFYLTSVMVRVPNDFESDVAGRPSFGIQNMIIDFNDGGGITVAMVGRDILDISDGSVDNLSFSLDSVYISVVQSSIWEGGLKGKIGLPIFAPDDYLNYEGLIAYDPAGTFRINFNVNVSDTLHVPMWDLAEMYFEPESTIGIEYSSGVAGTHVYADLSGGLNLVGNLGADASGGGGIPGLNFRGVRIEHLRYDSNGSRLTIGSTSFTSEAKSMAGFPVNIRNVGIDLSMPRVGLTFDVSLTLSDAGFSATAGFGVYGALDLSGDRDIFRFDGVDLRSIEIHQEVSSVRLDGRLDFYNGDDVYGDGIKGSLAVVMPMGLAASMTVQFGTKKRDGVVNPTYNTADFYPYWYVDGLVILPSPGLVIFSGFAIYGFGGGVYYHMLPDYSGVASYTSMVGNDKVEAPESGVNYTPDWGAAFGFKIKAVLGTTPSEDAFNMDVSIEMNFNESGGIGLFSIDGAGYVMASFAERPNAKIWATVHFAYVNPGDGSERVEGDFAIYVDYGSVLHGKGGSNEFVHAEFLVQDDIWYYYMGRQQMDQRGGLVVNLGDIINIDLSTYLMIGHGIPRRLPPLPEFIANLLYGPDRGRLNNGAADPSTIAGREYSPYDEQRMNNAEGFAFGTYLHLETRFDFAIFYAELEAHFGFDILVNKDEDRVCVETGLPPGINDWYAMGQVYLGLRGEFGVAVDLYFIKGEFPFIELAAAISMEGGFPNPTWATGRAGLHYSILGGMVEGQCNFVVQIGERCSVVNENPLSNIGFIADIQPADRSNPDVFVVPAVSFKLPVDQLLELPAGLDDDPAAVRVFRPYIDHFELIDVDGGNSIFTSEFGFNETNTIAMLMMDGLDILKGETRYKVEISVKAFEHFPDGSRRLVQEKGKDWEDKKSVVFTTGPAPVDIPESNVLFTYPIRNQAYFLQGEIDGSVGIRWMRPQPGLFDRVIDGKEYNYVARIKPVSGGNPIEIPVRTSVKGVAFECPNLENEEYFTIQIIRKPIRTLQETIGTLEARRSGAPLIPISTRFNLRDAGNVQVNVQVSQLPGAFVRSGESLLYHYYFRTSKFNTLSQKISSLNFTAESAMLGVIKLSGGTAEPFEEFDLKGYFKNGTKILEPLVSLTDPFIFDYHNNIAYPKVYDLYNEIRDLKYTDPVLTGMPFEYRGNLSTGFPPKKAVYVSPSTRIQTPLQEWELEREAGINRPATASPSTVSSGSSAHSIGSGNVSITSPGGSNYNIGVSGLLSGSLNNINVSSAYLGGGGGSSSYDFELTYSTSIFVKLDANGIKRRLSAIMSYRNVAGAYVYQNQILRYHSAQYGKIFQALLTNPDAFDFTPGQYGISIETMVPSLNEGSANQIRKSGIMKRFSYLQASERIQPELLTRPKRKNRLYSLGY